MKKQTQGFAPIKKEPKPNAQNAKECNTSYNNSREVELLYKLLGSIKVAEPTVYIILLMQIRYGFRISEVLGIRVCDISSYGRVLVKGLKGSSDRVVDFPEIHSLGFKGGLSTNKVFQGYSRFYVYRVYKRFSIGALMQGNKKVSVTHYPRYLAVQDVARMAGGLEVAGTFIGHKNIKNTEIYERKKVVKK